MSSDPLEFWGHSENDGGEGVPEPLSEHLRMTADLAEDFAAIFGARRQARMAGLVHDLGKYPLQFQRRVHGLSREAGRDHSAQGAWFLVKAYQKSGLIPALAVLGHHRGLPQAQRQSDGLLQTLKRAMDKKPNSFTGTDLPAMYAAWMADGFRMDPKALGGLALSSGSTCAADMLDTRMLFSALVDADYLATEAHFEGDARTPRRPRQPGPALRGEAALAALEARLAQLASDAAKDGESPMARVRRQLGEDCRRAAEQDTGLFTLAAPTGSGKTLAMLLFALLHAKRHNLRRIVLVMPYLNIIDQTAAIYRDLFADRAIFPDTYVLEDHSRADRNESDRSDSALPPDEDGPGDGRQRRLGRLLSENWDAPIVLTTNVGCLESLMSCRAAPCRKLHRLAGSVILFDEVQTLPQKLAVPTLATLSRLADRFGSTVVMATATQPAFDHFDEAVRRHSAAGWSPREIVGEPPKLFAAAAGRVKLRWRHERRTDLERLAGELAELPQRQWLCIVNLKRHAAGLAEGLRQRGIEGLAHLSTDMCPAHREKCLAEIRQRLKDGLPCRLVATQCVEAGVDLDFPVVYRALAPLEAIAQAAGRCNRHGKLPDGPGIVQVVDLCDEAGAPYPPGYSQAVKSTNSFLKRLAIEIAGSGAGCEALDEVEILNDPQRLRDYYRRHYQLTGAGECHSPQEKDMDVAITTLNFPEVARQYKLIEDGEVNILTRYDEAIFDDLRRELPQISGRDEPRPGFWRRWFARARPYSVSVHLRQNDPRETLLEPIRLSAARQDSNTATNWFLSLPGLEYDRDLLGLKTPDGPSGYMS